MLVNNAGNEGAEGLPHQEAFAHSNPASWRRYVDVNLYGVLNCTHATLPGMIARNWGRVVTIVSDAAHTGEKDLAVYSAAKAGAAAFTRTVARESGRFGITANSVSLGTMRTPATESLWANPDHPVATRILKRYAVRRPGAPEDVGAIVVFLASDHVSWITGQTYSVNGGSFLGV